MKQKINAIFTKRVLELNGSLRFNDNLSSCNRAQVSTQVTVEGSRRRDPARSFPMQHFVILNVFDHYHYTLCLCFIYVFIMPHVAMYVD